MRAGVGREGVQGAGVRGAGRGLWRGVSGGAHLVLQRRVVEVAELAPRLAGVAFAAVLANGQVLTHQRADGLQHLG